MMDGGVQKHKRTIDEMICGTGPLNKEVKLIEEDQLVEVIDMTETVASSELDPQVVEAMKKVWKAM